MIRNAIVCAALFSAASSVFAQDKLPSFRKIQLTDQFWSEGADYADFNHDGHMDIASGPFWYEGPDFKIRHEYRPANHSFKSTNAAGEAVTIPGFEGALGEKNEYSDDFFTFTFDVNGDGWPDIVNVGFPGKETFWYENPQNKEGHWKRHLILPSTDDESPAFGDLFGDGKRELICGTSNYLGYAAPADWNHPEVEWTFHRITTKSNGYHKFLHGLGFGDVNSDGRNDILIRTGWFEQPASLEGDPLWKFHPYPFAPQTKSPTWGSSQMYVYDVNGDGLPDVITCLDPHGFGLAWYEQLPGKGADGEIQFKRHLILNPDGSPNSYGVAFSEPHSVALVDIDGDGLKDIVTGKRFWAHGKHGGDPQSNYPAVLYWFKLVRGPNHTAKFVPHLIDSNSGVGTEVIAGDVNGDGRPDIVVGNKKGTFVFLQQ
ncbi:MAG TPA: VCBS repeat-containing protein [Verrucomicrobiae bacterium]|nr:VCBS repeat-containing protein [Verrucomicrobiae bacterium]